MRSIVVRIAAPSLKHGTSTVTVGPNPESADAW